MFVWFIFLFCLNFVDRRIMSALSAAVRAGKSKMNLCSLQRISVGNASQIMHLHFVLLAHQKILRRWVWESLDRNNHTEDFYIFSGLPQECFSFAMVVKTGIEKKLA